MQVASRACWRTTFFSVRFEALFRMPNSRALRHVVKEQQTAVESFLAHFTLTEEEADSLLSRDILIDKKFFRAMIKAERIMAESQVLMSGEDGSTKAG